MTHHVVGGPWKDRIGRYCRIVDRSPDGREVYPWAGRGDDEVIIFIPNDPYVAETIAKGQYTKAEREGHDVWTCAIGRKDIEPL